MQDNFSVKFGLIEEEEQKPAEEESKAVSVIEPDETSIERDYIKSREKINDILDIGSKAIKDLAELAKASQDPETYAVLSSLIKSVADVTGNLSKQHKDYKDIKGIKGSPTNANANTMKMDTWTLDRLLKEQK